MSGRAILFVVVGVVITSSFIFSNIQQSSKRATANFDSYFFHQTSRNIAQSGINMAMRQLAYNALWRTGFTSVTMLGGKANVRVFDTVYAGVASVAISGIGTTGTGIIAFGQSQVTSDTSTVYLPTRQVPPPLKGFLMTNGPTATAGGMAIDGRDHTISGNLNPGQGVYGIWTSSTFSQGGGSTVAGTVSGTDYAPKGWPKSSKVIQTLAPYTGYPTSPDSVFGGSSYGYPEGTLKSVALSGAGGSQYTTNPATLKYPLAGVTYVELASGASWSPNLLNGTGILVVHNTAKNAILVNVSGGTFTGILIGDDIIHLNNTILGEVVAITPAPSQGNVIGNGNGSLSYSAAAIKNAQDFLRLSGFGNSILAWKE